MEIVNIYFDELFSINRNDIIPATIFSIFVGINYVLYQINNKKNEVPDIFKIKVVDNKAYWSYNNSIYVGEYKNNSIVKGTARKIKIDGISAKDAEDVIELIGE